MPHITEEQTLLYAIKGAFKSNDGDYARALVAAITEPEVYDAIVAEWPGFAQTIARPEDTGPEPLGERFMDDVSEAQEWRDYDPDC